MDRQYRNQRWRRRIIRPGSSPLPKNRRVWRVLTVATCLAVLSLLAGGVLVALAQSRSGSDASNVHVFVAPGDTLWDIAADRAPRGVDLRYAIYQLRELNGLTSANLQVGRRIQLPPGWRPD